MKTQLVILAFAAVSLLLLTVLQGLRIHQGGAFSSNFAKLFGVIVIAGLGCAVAISTGIPAGTRTAVFTLLGTLAGYLAGAKPSTSTPGAGSRRRGARRDGDQGDPDDPGGRGDEADEGATKRRRRELQDVESKVEAENQL